MVARMSRPELSEVMVEMKRRHAELDGKRGRRLRDVGAGSVDLTSSYTAQRAERETKLAEALAQMAVVAARCEHTVRRDTV
jgi:hypothetical protein